MHVFQQVKGYSYILFSNKCAKLIEIGKWTE